MMTVSLADARAHFSAVVDDVQGTHERYTVTKNGNAVVVVAADDLASLEETLAIPGDEATMRGLLAADEAIAAGDYVGGGDLVRCRGVVARAAAVTYRLRVAGPAVRTIASDPPEAVAAAVLGFIQGPLLDNPQRVGKQLRAPLADRWSARRGQERVIHRIEEQQELVKVLRVLRVSHRRDAYRTSG